MCRWTVASTELADRLGLPAERSTARWMAAVAAAAGRRRRR